MARKNLSGMRVAVLAADGFEQVELTRPVAALRKHGAEVVIVSPHAGRIRGMNHLKRGKKIHVDQTLAHAAPHTFDALLLPGGAVNPDTLRQSEEARAFVAAFDRADKPIAVICHGPWVLASAGLVDGRTLTSWPGIRDDIANAGGIWRDEAVVRDANWVSSRDPHDLPKFIPAMVDLFAEHAPAPLVPAVGWRPRDVMRWLGGAVALFAAGLGLRRAAT